MALTSPQANNKMIQFRKELVKEYVRENLFSPYMGDGPNSIIRRLYDPKKGGEQINIPLVTRLLGTAKSTGTLVNSEESIDNYGMRAWVDWARHAVATNDAEEQKDSADVFGEVKPLLSDWGKELQRDEIIAAFMSLPSESAPTNLGSAEGQRVNGILYEDATSGQLNTFRTDNLDRVLYGNLVANSATNHSTSLSNVDAAGDTFVKASVRLLKIVAKTAKPRIRPFKVKDGREYFVCFAGSYNFAQLKADMATINSDARPRDVGANPIFQDGDLVYDGVIIREIPEIEDFVTNTWTSLLTAGATTSRVAPVFFCGQNSLAMPWAKMPTPTFRDETDYQFIKGAGVKMCYGVAKIFKKDVQQTNAKLVQFGMVTGFFSAAVPG
jgi:N4-gp56 family major capsid protein